MEKTYTDKIIDQKFESMEKILIDIRDNHLKEIKDQVSKTNGRVNSLENWKYLIIGGMTIISMMVIPLVIYIYNTHSNLDAKITNGIQTALKDYEKND